MGISNPSDPAKKWSNFALLMLLWPLIIEQFLAVTMGAADTLMVSPVGEFAVSGVNIADNINIFLIIALLSLSTGGAVVCSQYIGRGDHKNSRLAAKQLMYASTIVSFGLTVFALVFRRQLIVLLYGELADDVMAAAVTYLQITALSFPLLAIYSSAATLFRASGDSKTPMIIALLVNILHVGQNALFIHVLGMGVAGVSWSTFVSRLITAAVLFTILFRKKDSPVSLSGLFKINFVPSMTKRILRIGIPSGLEQSTFQFGRLLTQRIFPVFGTSMIAANAVAGTINSLGFMTGNAFTIAMLTVIGQCIGAGDYAAAKAYTKKITLVTWVFMFFISGLILVLRENMVSIFNLTREAHSAAISFLYVHSVSMGLFWTFSFAFPAALRAAGDAKYIMITGTISMWVVRVLASYFISFTLGIGPIGVWMAMGIDFIVRGIFFYTRWRSGKWQKIKLLDN